jgi:hypothetical protein
MHVSAVAYIHVSLAKRAKRTAGVWGISFIYRLYGIGAQWKLVVPLIVLLRRGQTTFNHDSEFSIGKE